VDNPAGYNRDALRLIPIFHDENADKVRDAQKAEERNRRLTDLAARLKDRPEVTVEYFVPDDRKSGGAYVTVTGRVRHISVAEKTLVMEDGMEIPMDDVVSLTGGIFCHI